MRAIILAAGYATRLRPLTDSIPKQLLPVGGRPMLDWVCDRVAEVTDNVELVTNARFADDFREWAKRRGGVIVHDDGTVSNEDRLGAIGDIAFYDCRDLELATHYGVVESDENDRVVGFEEKPSEPRSTLVATAAYIYPQEHVPLVARYLDEGNPPDQPGRLIAWLYPREPVYAYRFPGLWFDIGNPEQLLEADNHWRERAGLPPRETYSTLS